MNRARAIVYHRPLKLGRLIVLQYKKCKYQTGTPKVARKTFNIGEVWNPVCCHGNKTVELVLWRTFSRIVLTRIKHFLYKLAEISLLIIFDQNLVECMTSSIGISGMKGYLKIVNNIFLLIQTTFICLKMA